jgi:methionyl-tRNA formyltransferase
VTALQAVAERGAVAAVVLADGRPGLGPRALHRAWRRRRAAAPLRAEAERRGIPCLWFRPDRAPRLADALRRHDVDLICVATFPYLLPSAVLNAAREGAIGVHPSVLPRHRGFDPLFWTYHADDAETGVTVLRLDDGVDTGPVLAQERLALARGRLGSDLYFDLARRGASLLAEVVGDWTAARDGARPQDEQGATHEPAPRAGRWRIEFEAWGAERVWHFLRGVGERGGLVRDARGRPLAHGPARSFEVGPVGRAPGTVEVQAGGLVVVHCRDGIVHLERPGPRGR